MAEKKKKVTTTVTTTVTEEIINTPVNEKTHIICILDTSGSMSSIIGDSIGGFNTFLRKQKELPDDATITVVLFDDRYDVLYDNINIKNAEELTKNVWIPRGTTALYDAIGKTINNERANFTRLGKERPSKVLVCIVTDGMENASREYKLPTIKKLIKDCENDDWNFIYLAANQNAFEVGTSFGVSYNNTYTYTASSAGVRGMSATMDNVATSYRSMSYADSDFESKSKNLINQKDIDDGLLTTTGNLIYSGDTTTAGGTNGGNVSFTTSNVTTT